MVRWCGIWLASLSIALFFMLTFVKFGVMSSLIISVTS